MSRSGYNEDCDDNWDWIRYRGAVASAIKGRRGQDFLYEMLHAMAALPERKLISEKLEADGAVCAIGAVGKARGVDMSKLDPEDPEGVAAAFGIAPALAREIVYTNDDEYTTETPEQRFERMRRWVEQNLRLER